MNKKLSLSNLSENAICKENQGQIIGGDVRAYCWYDYAVGGKVGGDEQTINFNHHVTVLSVVINGGLKLIEVYS